MYSCYEESQLLEFAKTFRYSDFQRQSRVCDLVSNLEGLGDLCLYAFASCFSTHLREHLLVMAPPFEFCAGNGGGPVGLAAQGRVMCGAGVRRRRSAPEVGAGGRRRRSAPVCGAGGRRRRSAPEVGAGSRRRWAAPVCGAGVRRRRSAPEVGDDHCFEHASSLVSPMVTRDGTGRVDPARDDKRLHLDSP